MVMTAPSPSMVRTQLLPLQQQPLLIPTVCLAGIIDYTAPSQSAAAAGAFLGNSHWQGAPIPLLSFERLIGQPFSGHLKATRIAVLRKITGGGAPCHYYALVIQGLPRALSISREAFAATPDHGPAPTRLVMARVQVHGQPALIPDLPGLERWLEKLSHHPPIYPPESQIIL